MVWLHAWLGFLLTLLLAGAAVAQPAAVETAALSWVRAERAAACPDAAGVARSIEQRLGRQVLVSPAEADLIVEAYVDAMAAGGFHVSIDLARGGKSVGRRELESAASSCEAVADKAALVIALTIDPDAALEPAPNGVPLVPAEAPAVLPAPCDSKAEPTAAPPPPPPPPPPRQPVQPLHGPAWQGDLELAGGIATGIVPDLAPGIFARGRAFPPELPLGIEFGGAYFPPKTLESAPGKGADVTLFYVGAALCSRPRRSLWIRASLCGGAEVGAVAGQGHGFTSTPRFRTWTFALAARGRLGFSLTRRLAVVLGPSLSLPLKRDHFEVSPPTGTESLFRMSAVGLGFDLGAVWEL